MGKRKSKKKIHVRLILKMLHDAFCNTCIWIETRSGNKGKQIQANHLPGELGKKRKVYYYSQRKGQGVFPC